MRPEPITSVETCPVPLPRRMPESVVEPVPPEETERADARVRTPAESKVEVAVAPKYAESEESCEEEAFVNL